MRTFVLLICSAVIAFGILIAVLLSTRHYRPIRNIADYVRTLQVWTHGNDDRNHNELDLIRDSDAGMTGLIDLICDYVQANKRKQEHRYGSRDFPIY